MTNEQVREQIREEVAKYLHLKLVKARDNIRRMDGRSEFGVTPFDELAEQTQVGWRKEADQILSLLQPLIDQAVNHEANEWIAGISEALGRGYFVYDPKLGRTGSIERALDRVVARAFQE